MVAKSCKKLQNNFVCNFCYYSTSRKSSYNKHLTTLKHQYRTNLTELNDKKLQHNIYQCEFCNKNYNVRNSLWYHKQKCLYKNNYIVNNNENNGEIKEIKELKNLIIEIVKNNGDYEKNKNK